MLKIGLTGGIGAGKTTVAHIFEVLGIPIYFADDAAKKLMNENENLRQEIIKNFGSESYVDGKLNRRFLAEAIFSDSKKTLLINSIIHPATLADAEKWFHEQQGPYAIKEAALIFEANAENNLDLVIGVSSPLEIRLQRVMKRDGISLEAVEKRMQHQMEENKKMERCDFIIFNNDKDLLIPQVISIHENLLQNIERLKV